MSDNDDLLGDDLGDQSLADYNLGNEEEEQLLADDYENGGPQNVPSSIGEHYGEVVEIIPPSYSNHGLQYAPPPLQYQPMGEECVVPNITVEVPNVPPHPVYVPEPRHFEAEHAVPPAIPAGPVEPPQIVPSELTVAVPNNEGARERFISERPVGAQRMPQVRDIPDTLDAVVVPRFGRGRTTWRAAHYRHQHPYRRNYMHRGNFNQRHSFPPPQQIIRPNIPQQIIRQDIRTEMIRPEIRPDIRPEIRPEIIRPEIRPEIIRPDMIRPARPEMIPPELLPELPPPEMMRPMIRPELRPELIRPEMPMGPEISPERPLLPEMSFRPNMERPPFPQFQRFQFRPEERPMFMRPNFERPMYPFPRQFNPRFGPPMREIVGNPHMPRVTIRQVPDKEPEVRMLPVPLPPHIPPGGLAGKKVLINPHFKGNFQPVDGLPAYIPTRIHKSPPPSPTSTLGPVKDIDEAAERFIAEQRTALARSAARKFPPRRSPQRYIENTTIEIENELAARPRRRSEDELLRRQEEFINENRAGLRRRMRSPSPLGRRSPSPGPAARRPRPDTDRRDRHDEDEYSRRLREQQSLREHVVRAKEVRRRRNAANLHKQLERDQEPQKPTEPSKDKSPPRKDNIPPPKATSPPKEPPTSTEETKPDTTRNTPEKSPEKERKDSEKEKENEKVKEKSPVKAKDDEVNSTCEALTPPWRGSEDDDLDMILGDIDGILSDEDDSGRFKHKPDKTEPPKSKPPTDLRSKLPPKHDKPARQKIVFVDDERNKKDKTPPRRAVVSSTKADEAADKLFAKTKAKAELLSNRSRQRITFDKKEPEKTREKETKQEKTPPFSNRRVILQRKVSKDKPLLSRIEDRSQPSAGIFSRAVRTAIGDSIVRRDEPQIEYESDSDLDEDTLLNEEVGNIAAVENLPHGMTDSRLRALAGNDVQNLVLDKEERSAKITFKTTLAAETFKKKFNNKMVAASRLSVALR